MKAGYAREISLVDEVDYGMLFVNRWPMGTEARISADEKYFKAKQSLNERASAAGREYTNNVAKAYENLNKEIKQLNPGVPECSDRRHRRSGTHSACLMSFRLTRTRPRPVVE